MPAQMHSVVPEVDLVNFTTRRWKEGKKESQKLGGEQVTFYNMYAVCGCAGGGGGGRGRGVGVGGGKMGVGREGKAPVGL